MICTDICVIYKYRVKQLMIFERTVAAASDFKNCTMVNCDKANMVEVKYEPRFEKTGLRGFRPSPTQTGLYSIRRWLEA